MCSRDDLFEIGSNVTVVCNLIIGLHTSRSANRLGSYYSAYKAIEPCKPIVPCEPMCVGSHSSY